MPFKSICAQGCRFVAAILFALCFVGVSGAVAVNLGDESPPRPSLFIAEANSGLSVDEFSSPIVLPRRPFHHQDEKIEVVKLTIRNVQVRAEYDVSPNDIFEISDDGRLLLTATISDNRIFTVTVRVEDDFNYLNSAYENLRAEAVITVEVLGTLRLVDVGFALVTMVSETRTLATRSGEKPHTYTLLGNPPSYFTLVNDDNDHGIFSFDGNGGEGEYILTVQVEDAGGAIDTALVLVTVGPAAMLQVVGGAQNAVFLSQGAGNLFNPKSPSGVLVSTNTEEVTVALVGPDNAWQITLHGEGQAFFAANPEESGGVMARLEGDVDFVRVDSTEKISLDFVFSPEVVVPVTPMGTRIFSRGYGGEWYLVIDEGGAEIDQWYSAVNFLALNNATWFVGGQILVEPQPFALDGFMTTVAHLYTGDIGTITANFGVAPSFSLTDGTALISERIGTEYYPQHGAQIAIADANGPMTLSYTVVAEDHLGDILGGYGYVNRVATVTGAVVVLPLPVASFAGQESFIYKHDLLVGRGAIISITLSTPASSSGLLLSLIIISDSDNYTVTALDDGDTCTNDICLLLIDEGQIEKRLSVLTQANMTLSLVLGGIYNVKITLLYPVCERTPQVRAEITLLIGKECEEITNEDLEDIQVLRLDNLNITSLKEGDFSGLTNLLRLDLSGNFGFTTLPVGVFNGLTNLWRLDLSNNRLTTLPVILFNGLTNLWRLDLTNNRLTTIPVSVFNGLTNLEQLDLFANNLTTLSTGVFSGLTNLQQLNLDSNDLTTLPAGVFSELTNLQQLDLYHNDLTTLPAGVFSGLTNLMVLNLRYNNLTTLPVGVFNGLTNLEQLYLYRNDLINLPAGTFNGLTNLGGLDLSNNLLINLPIDVNGLTNLTWLRLLDNPGGNLCDDYSGPARCYDE